MCSMTVFILRTFLIKINTWFCTWPVCPLRAPCSATTGGQGGRRAANFRRLLAGVGEGGGDFRSGWLVFQ